jgi:hypothetical protein
VQDTNATMLVYGWKLIDYEIPERGAAKMLLAPTSQTSSAQSIMELRVLEASGASRSWKSQETDSPLEPPEDQPRRRLAFSPARPTSDFRPTEL